MRPVADEIVVAVDDRVDPGVLSTVSELADRVLLVPYADPPERTFQWLHEQTASDWVFRIDDDEMPSQTLLDQLAEPPGDVTHCFVPRRWLWRDGWLDSFPWRPDWQLRLAQRDAVSFPGELHLPVRGAGPCRFLAAPIYHVDLLDSGRDVREAKVRRYGALRPGLRVAGRPLNEAYYLPETRDPTVTPIPDEDLPLVQMMVEAPELPSGEAPELRRATREAIDARWAGRRLPESAYRARIELLTIEPLIAGEVRQLETRVTNLGTETWPNGADGLPEIRLSYQGLADALRTPLPHDLGPGETTLVPVSVRAPKEAGIHPVELDLVHEGHRWFGCVCRVPLEVLPRRRAVVLVGQPPGDEAFDVGVLDLLGKLDPALEPLLVGPKPDWLRDRFGIDAQDEPPSWRPDAVLVLPAGRRRDRLRLALLARRLGRHARG
jgi:hypothetical protein